LLSPQIPDTLAVYHSFEDPFLQNSVPMIADANVILRDFFQEKTKGVIRTIRWTSTLLRCKFIHTVTAGFI
jgi:hypothetical protein